MTISSVDTLRFSRRLVGLGLEPAQADEIAACLRAATAITQTDLVRRGELDRLTSQVERHLYSPQQDLLTEIRETLDHFAALDSRITSTLRNLRIACWCLVGLAALIAALGAACLALTDISQLHHWSGLFPTGN